MGGPEPGEPATPRVLVYGYFRGACVEGDALVLGRRGAAGAIPTDGGLTCVFVAMPPARYQATGFDHPGDLFEQVLRETNADLARTVARASLVGKPSVNGQPGFLAPRLGPGWALVGDAGCFKDPLTAHGMTDALRDAELLATAALTGTNDALAAYAAARDPLATVFVELSDEVSSFEWDLPRLKSLHLELSQLMNREYALIGSWPDVPAAGPAACAASA